MQCILCIIKKEQKKESCRHQQCSGEKKERESKPKKKCNLFYVLEM